MIFSTMKRHESVSATARMAYHRPSAQMTIADVEEIRQRRLVTILMKSA